MKDNRLRIQINKPVSEVFDFTLDPKNTPLWINSVDFEKTSEWPVKVGTVYENHLKSGQVFNFEMTELEKDNYFALKEVNSDYHCRYTFKKLDDNSTDFEYFEWVEEGQLNHPFPQATLEKLKSVMESD